MGVTFLQLASRGSTSHPWRNLPLRRPAPGLVLGGSMFHGCGSFRVRGQGGWCVPRPAGACRVRLVRAASGWCVPRPAGAATAQLPHPPRSPSPVTGAAAACRGRWRTGHVREWSVAPRRPVSGAPGGHRAGTGPARSHHGHRTCHPPQALTEEEGRSAAAKTSHSSRKGNAPMPYRATFTEFGKWLWRRSGGGGDGGGRLVA
jgi:hypothetical protein